MKQRDKLWNLKSLQWTKAGINKIKEKNGHSQTGLTEKSFRKDIGEVE